MLQACLDGAAVDCDEMTVMLERAVFDKYGDDKDDYERAIRFIADYSLNHDFPKRGRMRRMTKKKKNNDMKNVVRELVKAYDEMSYSAGELEFRKRLDRDVEKHETAMHLIRRIGEGSGVVVTCIRCRGSQVAVSMKQLRSADEGMTSCYSCAECGASWRD